MRNVIYLLFHLLTTVAKLLRPGGGRKPGPKGPSAEVIKANLRVLDIEEIKSLPHVPMSHPLVERLIGSIRRLKLVIPFKADASEPARASFLRSP